MAAIPVNFVIIISLIITLWYLLGVHYFVTKVEENTCDMTYMFEYPQYVELSLPPDIQQQHPLYSLYGYSEGGLTEDLRSMKFTGIPVLFIPGNSGSHRQGRSLASVALRKAINSRSPFHFDFFLVEFNEDLSGLYGGVLVDETRFVIACIDKILRLYKGTHVPTSIALIGHSAGGIVAKAVFSFPEFNPQSVHLVITLATPNAAPAVQVDPHLVHFYSRVNRIWSQRTANTSHVTLASIGGGERDIIVRSDLIKDPNAVVNVLTTGIPGVHRSTDHLSITWCKQFILTIVRVLFDSVDINTKQFSTDAQYRKNVLEYHLLRRSAGKKYAPHAIKTRFERNARWIENLQRQFTVMEKKGVKSSQFVMIRLWNDPKHEVAVLEAVNLNVKDWVYVCNADSVENDSRVCEEGVNLSNLTEIIPAEKSRRKIVKLDMLDLKNKGFSHVVVRIPPATSYMQLNVDVHKAADRVVSRPVPRVSSLSSTVLMESTTDNAVHHRILLPGFDQIWQAFVLHVEAVTCKADKSHAVITFSVPWANETQHFILADKREISLTLKLTSPRPNKDHNMTAQLDLILDPSCKYSISLRPDVIAVAGQCARYFSVLLPGYIVAVLVMTLRRQLDGVNSGTGVPLFHNALAESARKYYVILQTVIIGSKLIGAKMFAGFLPQPDPQSLIDASMDFFFLPIILFGVATMTAYVAGGLIYAGIIVSGQAAHKLALRFVARTVTGFVCWSDWVVSALHQLPFAVGALLISLSCSTAGGLALSLAAAFYFLKLSKLYEDYLENLLKISLKYVAKKIASVTGRGKKEASKDGMSSDEDKPKEEKKELTGEDAGKKAEDVGETAEVTAVVESELVFPEISTLEEIHFHVTLCLLYIVTAAITVPSVLSWSRSFHQTTLLVQDPFWWPAIVLCAAACVLWQGAVPRPNLPLARAAQSFLLIIAVFSIMFASVSLYRLPFLSCAAVIFVAIHHVSARWL